MPRGGRRGGGLPRTDVSTTRPLVSAGRAAPGRDLVYEPVVWAIGVVSDTSSF
jgi:hypothetical protein